MAVYQDEGCHSRHEAKVLRILGKRQSINVRKVLWTCDEVGAPYIQEDWGAGTRLTSCEEFLQLNPKGLVPVVIDGNATLTESNTIVRYLAAKYGRADLLPAEPLARARVEEIMDWQATELNGSWRTAFLGIVRKNSDAGTSEQIVKSQIEWTRMMRLLERQLDDNRSFICGSIFTVSDVVIGLSVNRWFQTPMERPSLPLVQDYLARLALRPSARGHIGKGTD